MYITRSELDSKFEVLLDYLRQSHGFDFTTYKRPSLMRRVQNRMQALSIENYSAYLDYIKENPEEFTPLFNTIEINFTGFFRDPEAWNYIAKVIIPGIIAGKSESEPIRIWSAGCASGEETYTLAILLAEVLGIKQYKAQVRIYATDIDTEALNQARLGSYLNSQVVGVPPTLLERYFEQSAERYIFGKDLRRSIIFCRHNLMQDAPMSKIDLLVCRNVLIYFNTDSQTKTLARFHFSLKDSGFLFLGMSEMLPTHTNLFNLLNLRQRVFTKIPRSHVNQRLLNSALLRRH
jgi:two-component system CheB/CheR fusion protein